MKKLLWISLIVLGSMRMGYSNPTSITLTPNNHVALTGTVNGSSVSQAISDIISNSNRDIYLFLDSPGGEITAGLKLISAMKASGKHITCIANFAASMAFIILQYCDERYITIDGVIMQHVASYGVAGNAPNNLSFVTFLERMLSKLLAHQANRLSMSVDQFKEATRDDLWLFADDAVTYKAADKTVSVTCSRDLLQLKRTVATVGLFGMQGPKVSVSKCPLITSAVDLNSKSIKSQNLIK